MINIFKSGQEASKSTFIAALTELRQQGAGALATLGEAQLDTLVEFERRLSAINGCRVLAWRIDSKSQALKFVVSDFTDIDQANTIGTVRADSASVSLKERAAPAEAIIKSNNFSANMGTIETLNSKQSILRVHTDNGAVPTGEFDIELIAPLTINQFIIQIVASPSQPTVVASVSNDGLTYTSATQIAINGYTINVWLPSTEVRFIRIQITPSHPDNLNGNSFTFGITNFSAQATEYHLRSDFVTKALQFTPKSEYVLLNAVSNPHIQYYLSVWEAGTQQSAFVEMNPGDAVKIGNAVSLNVTTNAFDVLTNAPESLYLNTVKVTEAGRALNIAPGLSSADSNIADLSREYITVVQTSAGYSIGLLNAAGSSSRTFAISYVYGPSLVNVQLKVRLSTDDNATSPIFHGASLDEV